MRCRAVLVFLSCLWLLAGEVPGPGSARWLTYPEPLKENISHERFYRGEFTISGEIADARLHALIDDKGCIWLNGQVVLGASVAATGEPQCWRVGKYLVQGRNALGFRVVNLGDVGGVIARLEITYRDGRVQDAVTTLDWLCGKAAEDGWNTAGFGGKNWVKPQTHGDLYVRPWSVMFNMSPLLTSDEQRDVRKIADERQAAMDCVYERLKAEKAPRASVEYVNNRACIRLDDRVVPAVLYHIGWNFPWDNLAFRNQLRSFCKGGTDLVGISFGLKSFWHEDGSVDVEHIKKQLLNALILHPNATFTVGFNTSETPRWWLDAHPGEAVQYATGPVDKKTDNVFLRYYAASFASEAWRTDIRRVIRQAVAALEASPLAARIFSYRIDSGIYGEWHYYGMQDDMPDASAPMTNAFRNWLKRRYASDELLQAAWKQPAVTRENAVTPPPDARRARGAGQMRDPVADRWMLDYLACHGEVLKDCILDFAKAAKDASHNRALVGNYSGYAFALRYPAEAWHFTNDAVLDSPYIDFQLSPLCYGHDFRAPGATGQLRSLVDTYRLRGKLCILEADTRTCLEPNRGHTFVKTDEESVAVLARDMATALSHGCGIWYFDFAKAWYALPKMQRYLEKSLPELRALDTDFGSAAEVALVFDWGSVPYHAVERPMPPVHCMATEDNLREIGLSGIGYDIISFADLANPRLKDYKVYVFLNAIYLDVAKRAVLDRLKSNGRTLVWMYATGYLNEKGHDPDNIGAVTGIAAREIPGRAKNTLAMDGKSFGSAADNAFFPVFAIDDPKAAVSAMLKTEQGDLPALATKRLDGWTSVLCTSPFLPRQAMRKICADANVHRYCDRDDAAVYANASMVMLHTGKPGDYTLKFTRPATWTQVFPERREFAGQSPTHIVKADGAKTYFFLCK